VNVKFSLTLADHPLGMKVVEVGSATIRGPLRSSCLGNSLRETIRVELRSVPSSTSVVMSNEKLFSVRVEKSAEATDAKLLATTRKVTICTGLSQSACP